MNRTIIGVLTSQAKYENRRQAVRNTWGRDAAANPNCDMVFLIGDPKAGEARREGDVLYLPCPDDYHSLPQKTRQFCKWALWHGGKWDYLFKCDDDTYVQVERLLSEEWQAPIVGGQHTDEGHFHGGAGYTINRQAAMAIVEHMDAPKGLEDWKARDAIHAAGLKFSLDARLCWDKSNMPLPRNTNITCHYASPLRMRLIYDDFRRDAPSNEAHQIPKVMHHIWLGGEMPDHLRQHRDSWLSLHSDWESYLWGENNIHKFLSEEQKRLFDAAPTLAQKSHVARYAILHHMGGVYIDCDVECKKNIEPLLIDARGVAAAEDDDAAGVAVLACCAGDVLMGRCCAAMSDAMKGGKDIAVESGSRFFTQHLLSDPTWQVHWWNTFYPKHWDGRQSAPIEEAHAIHHWNASWRKSA